MALWRGRSLANISEAVPAGWLCVQPGRPGVWRNLSVSVPPYKSDDAVAKVVAHCDEAQREDCTAALQGAFDHAAALPRPSGALATVVVPPLSRGDNWTIAGVPAGGLVRLRASRELQAHGVLWRTSFHGFPEIMGHTRRERCAGPVGYQCRIT